MNSEQLRAAAADLASDGRVRCFACRAWTTTKHIWDDGLFYVGSLCRDCARPRAERDDAERRQAIEAWTTFAADHPVAREHADRLAAEYAAERAGRFDHCLKPPPRLPTALLAAFRAFWDRMGQPDPPSAPAAPQRRRAARRDIPAGGL